VRCGAAETRPGSRLTRRSGVSSYCHHHDSRPRTKLHIRTHQTFCGRTSRSDDDDDDDDDIRNSRVSCRNFSALIHMFTSSVKLGIP